MLYNFWHKYCQIDVSAGELCFPIDFSDHDELALDLFINYAYVCMLIGQHMKEQVSRVTSHR